MQYGPWTDPGKKYLFRDRGKYNRQMFECIPAGKFICECNSTKILINEQLHSEKTFPRIDLQRSNLSASSSTNTTTIRPWTSGDNVLFRRIGLWIYWPFVFTQRRDGFNRKEEPPVPCIFSIIIINWFGVGWARLMAGKSGIPEHRP